MSCINTKTLVAEIEEKMQADLDKAIEECIDQATKDFRERIQRELPKAVMSV